MVAKNDTATESSPTFTLAADREHDAVGSGQLGKVTARVLTTVVRD